MKIDRPIAIAVIFFVIILLAFFWVVPEYKKMGQLRLELAETKAQFNAEYDYYAAIAKTYNKLMAHAEDLKKIDDALPTDPALGKTIYFLQQTTMEAGMMMRNLSLSKSSSPASSASAGKTVNDMVFSLDLLGDYASLGRLIVSLEKSSRIFEVTDISFGSSFQPIFEGDQSQFQMPQIFSFKLQVKTHTY